MKVILLKDIAKLGRKYDIKEVASGHALNLLIPRGEAMPATKSSINQIATLKAKAEGDKKLREDIIAKNIKDLDGITVSVSGKANDKGHLFAGLHREAIAAEVQRKTKLQIDPSFIQLDHPIKEAGEHIIQVRADGKSAKFKLVIEVTK